MRGQSANELLGVWLAVAVLLVSAGFALAQPAGPSDAGPDAGEAGGTEASVRADEAFDSSSLGPSELPPTTLSYRIEARLEPATRRVIGTEVLRWRNPAAHAIEAVPLHLYLNAFSHLDTTWMREARPGRAKSAQRIARSQEQPWGWIELERVEQRPDGGDALPCSMTFVQPDDGNPLDRSLGEVSLPQPIAPGDELVLEMSFVAQLPIPVARTGGVDDYFHVAQWFPKIGVYEPAGVRGSTGRWAARQFHGSTEFYADFADYDVTVEVPEGFVVVATGEQREASGGQPGQQRARFVQRAVHDFAFVAGRDLHVESHPFTPQGGGGRITILYVTPKGSAHHVSRMREAAERTFDVLGARVGPYPFSTMKVIQPPWKAARTAGMEYPTLITGIPSDPLFDAPGLAGVRVMEGVVAHEVTHNYFQGLVANDEQREAFLDEGFTDYWETEITRSLAGGDAHYSTLFGHPTDPIERDRFALAEVADEIDEPIIQQPSNLFYPGTGRFQIYTRSILVFATAARLFSQREVDRIFSAYFHRFRFGHPATSDFLAVVDEVAAPGLGAFLHEALTARRIPDLKVERASTERWLPPLGRVPTPDGSVVVTEEMLDEDKHSQVGLDPAAREPDGQVLVEVVAPGYWHDGERRDGRVERKLVAPRRVAPVEGYEPQPEVFYRSAVRLRGPGWQHLPVDVRFRFADGVVVRDSWDGRSSWRAYRFLRGAPLSEVQMDPDDKLVVDPWPGNNGRLLETDWTVASDWAFWLSAASQWVATGVSLWL